MSLLGIDGVDAYYGESHILRSISMAVEEGEICALLGRNGAGKTTTVRCVSGATPPEVRSGRISFRGDDITGDLPNNIAMKGIALVPEERRVFPNLTVEENLHMAEVAGNWFNRVGRRLSRETTYMPLGDIYDAFPRLDERQEQDAGTLSGGEQQMLAIARALRQDPDLLMLDEPYEGLAPHIIEEVEAAIDRINEAGTTILLIEQNAAAAIEISDRCYVIDMGQVVFDGTAAELRDDTEARQRYLGV
ncbi:MAG: ABC transporter ATP-binding protein [Haloarculaceae archaeon]